MVVEIAEAVGVDAPVVALDELSTVCAKFGEAIAADGAQRPANGFALEWVGEKEADVCAFDDATEFGEWACHDGDVCGGVFPEFVGRAEPVVESEAFVGDDAEGSARGPFDEFVLRDTWDEANACSFGIDDFGLVLKGFFQSSPSHEDDCPAVWEVWRGLDQLNESAAQGISALEEEDACFGVESGGLVKASVVAWRACGASSGVLDDDWIWKCRVASFEEICDGIVDGDESGEMWRHAILNGAGAEAVPGGGHGDVFVEFVAVVDEFAGKALSAAFFTDEQAGEVVAMNNIGLQGDGAGRDLATNV